MASVVTLGHLSKLSVVHPKGMGGACRQIASLLSEGASVRRLRVGGLASLAAGWVGCSRNYILK